MRVLIEVLHIFIGLCAALIIAKVSIWSYPLAQTDIWRVTIVAMVAVAAMGIGPIRRALAEDRATLDQAGKASSDE